VDWHTGKVALVAGGGRGIGRGIALCLARDGADLVIVDRIGENARAVASEVEAAGRRALGLAADLTRRVEAERAVATALERMGRIDIAVNSTGVGGGTGWKEREESLAADWDAAWDANVRAHAFVCEAVAPHMVARRAGKIVNVASIAAWVPARSHAHYGASKAACVNYTQSLALLLGPHNINVNAVCPGLVWTDMTEGTQRRLRARTPDAHDRDLRAMFEDTVGRAIPLGREQTPEDIGNTVSFLCSERARNIHAQSVNIDGGATIH
jgi:NAD(P)-dependent dehydrogenase (short-subunit alcohol dehydrogenase family)